MAKFYSLNEEIYAVRMTEQEELDYPVAGHDDETVDIDPEVNAAVFEQYAQDHNNHSLVSGILCYQGQKVTILTHGQTYLDHQAAKSFWQDLNNEMDWLESQFTGWDALTGAQKQQWIVNNFDRVLRGIHGIMRFVRWLIKGILKLKL